MWGSGFNTKDAQYRGDSEVTAALGLIEVYVIWWLVTGHWWCVVQPSQLEQLSLSGTAIGNDVAVGQCGNQEVNA
jgi:hypothetical protein